MGGARPNAANLSYAKSLCGGLYFTPPFQRLPPLTQAVLHPLYPRQARAQGQDAGHEPNHRYRNR
jgi:hypothetical protein